jgi:hypothetical protein
MRAVGHQGGIQALAELEILELVTAVAEMASARR